MLEKGRGKCRREGGVRGGRHGSAGAAFGEVAWEFHAQMVSAELVLQGFWAWVYRTVTKQPQSDEQQQE